MPKISQGGMNMCDEMIDIYFDYWINKHIYREVLEKNKYYNDVWEEIKNINKSLEQNSLEEYEKDLLFKLNDLFNSIIEIERELGYKFGFKTGVRFMIELLE